MEKCSAFVAIVGLPNVGKSSLLNRFIGEKVAIVTPKPQTTRTRITGILTRDPVQLVFIDTPGIHKPRTRLSDYMVKQVRESVADVDVAILVTEPTGDIRNAELELVQSFEQRRIPALLAVNKIDTLSRRELMLDKIDRFSRQFSFDAIIPVSAKTCDGVDILLEKAASYAQPGPYYFDESSITDQPEQILMAEIVREKLLRNLHEEIPHGTAVVVEQMKERDDRDIMDILVTIYCEKDSHKGMVIGKSGAMLKTVASQARADMEAFLGVTVNLQCWVRVKDDWRNREGLLRGFGFQ